jgi:hypothetical protein
MEKMTKKELAELVEAKEEELKELRKKQERYEQYKQYDEFADQVKAMYDSFINAGFNDKQAMKLVEKAMDAATAMNVSGSKTRAEFLRSLR